MRARVLLTGLILIAAACSRPAAETAVDEALDARNENPDLALTPRSDQVPVASDVEVGRPAAADEPSPQRPTPRPPRTPEPLPEPIAADHDGELAAAPAASAAPMPVEEHVHPEVSGEALSGPSAEGGGKPTGVSTGLGPVPDRNWGDSGTGVIDDPNPVPGMTGTLGTIGRDGLIIIRGGVGGMHDDCKIHPRGGAAAGTTPTGPAVLVNDRGPRGGGGALINERAPRTSRSPLPGGGFPRGGGMRGGIRGGIR